MQLFQFESNEIRFVEVDGQPCIVATDLLRASESKTTITALEAMIVEGLGDEFVSNQPIFDRLGREQTALVLTEPAFTFYLSRSRTEAGKKLNRWIHVEVLPSIRRTGSYSVVPQTYLEALKALVAAEEEKARLVAEVESQKQELAIADAVIEEQAETIDEIYGWSSIVRVSIENNVKETIYQWRKLKAATLQLGLEPKRVPCPRFGEKLLYPAEAWAIVYPDAKMPKPKQSASLTTYNNHKN